MSVSRAALPEAKAPEQAEKKDFQVQTYEFDGFSEQDKIQTAQQNEFSAVSIETSKAAETYGVLGVNWRRRDNSF